VAAWVVAGGEPTVGLGVEGGVGDRVEEHLVAEHRTAAVVGQQRDRSGDGPADAVPGDRDAAAVQSTLVPVGATHLATASHSWRAVGYLASGARL
jgi:hypothetical protein